MTAATATPAVVPPEATGVSITMPASSASAVQANNNPRKLKHDDDDEEDHALLQGGPFENAKRKCSWSASSMRKELGSPRMANSEHSHAHAGFGLDGSTQLLPHQFQPHPHAHPAPQGGDINAQKTERSCTANVGATFLQELGSALVSCGGAGAVGNLSRPRTFNCNNNGNCSGASNNAKSSVDGSPSDLMTVATSWVRIKDSFQKAVKGDLDAAKEAWSGGINLVDLSDDLAVNSVGSHDSILTYDNYSVINQKQAHLLQQEEEAMQLRRLTSWGTVGTYETIETSGTGAFNADSLVYNTKSTATNKGATSAATAPGGPHVVEDDDGIPIDVHLLHSRGKKLQLSNGKKQSEPRRKRVVRFDYPPISSLRECPRTQPEQIEDLFFTEHELEQIEDDRYSTISADDVEIVAISTSTTAESESCEDTDGEAKAVHSSNTNGNNRPSSVSKSLSSPHSKTLSGPTAGKDENIDHSNDPSFRGYVGASSKQKKESRKGRRTFSFDEVVSGRGVGASNSSATNESNSNKKNNSRRRRSSNDANGNQNHKGSPSTNSGSSRRMIKSVQIYLRERSVG